MTTPDLHRITDISPMWWGAIASAAAAGAILLPDHKLVAGGIAGAALLVLALAKLPCCAGCAAGKTGCVGTTTAASSGATMTAPSALLAPVASADLSQMLVQPSYAGCS